MLPNGGDMSASFLIKKSKQARREALHTKAWELGKRRNVDGVVYLTRKDARMARKAKREAAAA
jgi:hypothetical protein